MKDKLKRILNAREKKRVEAEGLKQAAVLVPIYERDGDYYFILTRRTENVMHHKGQISFPGGERDAEDSDLFQTALREAQEEVGIARAQVEVIGELDEVTSPAGYVITPIVGFINPSRDLAPNPAEVAEVIHVPLSALSDPKNFRQELIDRGGQARLVPFYSYGDYVIWGVTARIIKDLLALISSELGRGA